MMTASRSKRLMLFGLLSALCCAKAVPQPSVLQLENYRNSYQVLASAARGNATDTTSGKCGLPVISFAFRNRTALPLHLAVALKTVLNRPALETSILSGHFRIHYDTSQSSPNTPAMLDANHQRVPGTANQYADSVARIANYVWTYEIGTLGYVQPPTDDTAGGGPEYDIYILLLSPGEYGETDPEIQLDQKPDGGRFTTFMKIHNDFTFVYPDSNKGLPALRVTIAHEFHHAIQLGSYGYWASDVYYHEITSVWMEDVVFTEVNDYYNYLNASFGQFRNPDRPFNTSDLIMYSRGIWGQYIAKKFGRDAMRRSWEYISSVPPLQAIDNMLRERSTNFPLAFSEWNLWNYFTGVRSDSARYYPEGRYYPLIIQLPLDYASGVRTQQGTLQNLSARYYDVLLKTAPLTLVLSNINFASALAGNATSYPYTYLLSDKQLDQFYRPTAATDVFVKLDVPDPSNWLTWDIINGAIGSAVSEGLPFPNPFKPNGSNAVYFPIQVSEPVKATLSIFSSSMDLIYSSEQTSNPYLGNPYLGKQAFSWNGKTNAQQTAGSGIYVFVLALDNRTITGKIALLRK